MNIALPERLTVDEFLAWAVRQKQGKYELVAGAVVEEPRQNCGHTQARLHLLLALREAISERASEFYVMRIAEVFGEEIPWGQTRRV